MVVACVTNTYNERKTFNSLTIGNRYCVVTITVNIGSGEIMFNVINDNGQIAFYEPEFFEIVDNRIGVDWVLRHKHPGYYAFMPTLIAYDGFWEDYHNDDFNARGNLKKAFPEFANTLK